MSRLSKADSLTPLWFSPNWRMSCLSNVLSLMSGYRYYELKHEMCVIDKFEISKVCTIHPFKKKGGGGGGGGGNTNSLTLS